MELLYNSPIFKGLTEQEVDRLLDGRSSRKRYKKGESVAAQGSAYHALLIVARGAVRGEMVNFAGDLIVIEEIPAPRAIAPAILYATESVLPVNVVAMEDTELVSITKGDFTNIMQLDERVLINFMTSVSNRSKFLADRVRLMRFGTIRSKLARYLLEAMQEHGSVEFDITHTQQELADMFGVTRPALSRALAQLSDEGIVTSRRNHFAVNSREELMRAAKEL